MKVLVIDNIDSFVYNLVQYVGILRKNPLVVNNQVSLSEVEKKIKTHSISHIVISPGPKTPREAGMSNQIIKKFSQEIPTLGICLGHQCLAYSFGAKIRRAKKLKHGKTSLIEHDNEGIFQGIKNPLEATRYHSLVVDFLPKCLEVTAKSIDDNEIMGIKHRKFPIYGLQFHPESILTNEGMRIIKNFLDL